jgi:hypothetical protein
MIVLADVIIHSGYILAIGCSSNFGLLEECSDIKNDLIFENYNEIPLGLNFPHSLLSFGP